MILDSSLEEGKYKIYEDLGNGWAEEIKPIEIIKELQQRIDKSVEYIINNDLYTEKVENGFVVINDNKQKNHLLRILRGECNE